MPFKTECTDEFIKNDIILNLPIELRNRANLIQTGPIDIVNNRKMARISRKLDTACPYQIRQNWTQKDGEQRLPNAIGLGTHKSGTGALAFLDCHPNNGDSNT